MKPKQAVLIISGYNTRAVIAFCRWATVHKIEYHIIARNEDDPIFLSAYKDSVAFTRTAASLIPNDFCSWVKLIRDQYSYDRILVLPSTEYLNRFLLAHRDVIEAEHCIIPLVDSKCYSRVSDKHKFAKLCESAELDIPAEFPDMPDTLPFVAKPRTYCSDSGRQLIPHLVSSEHDLRMFCSEEDPGDYFFQVFVVGESHYLLAYLGKGKEDILFSQENLIQQARGGSIILARRSDFHQTSIAKHYIEMLHDVNYVGLIMIEVRLDKSSGRYFMIEANPRLWGPMQFCIDNDIDLFRAMLCDYDFEVAEIDVVPHSASFYFWSGGISEESQPLAYHNYSYEKFVNELPAIRSQDIFSRKDSHELFMKEPQMEDIHEK